MPSLKPLTILLLLACLVLASGWAFTAHSATASQRSLERIADEKAQLEMQQAGFISAFAQVGRWATSRDSTAKALEKALKASETLRYARTELRIESRIDTQYVAVAVGDSAYHARVDSDPFHGDIEFNIPRTQFRLNLECVPRLEQYIAQSASDRLLIGVRPLSPNTEVRVEAFDATPYLRPYANGGVRWYHLPLAAMAGILGWELAK